MLQAQTELDRIGIEELIPLEMFTGQVRQRWKGDTFGSSIGCAAATLLGPLPPPDDLQGAARNPEGRSCRIGDKIDPGRLVSGRRKGPQFLEKVPQRHVPLPVDLRWIGLITGATVRSRHPLDTAGSERSFHCCSPATRS